MFRQPTTSCTQLQQDILTSVLRGSGQGLVCLSAPTGAVEPVDDPTIRDEGLHRAPVLSAFAPFMISAILASIKYEVLGQSLAHNFCKVRFGFFRVYHHLFESLKVQGQQF